MIHVGTNEITDLHNGTARVATIHVGTQLAYSHGTSDLWTLYNAGYISGVEWSADRLPHRAYYNASVCKGDLSHAAAADGGYMTIHMFGSYSNQYNAHVCGAQAYLVPGTATKMCVEMRRAVNPFTVKFGLMPENCTNSMDTSNGGVLTETLYPTNAAATYTLTLPQGFAGSAWVPVINAFEIGNALRDLTITKIWFE